jgi:polypeptide N-acetylgalactosaminyltransferase
MDEYKEHLYKRRPHWKSADAGDLTAQFEIRDRLKCKSFKWFMTEIAFDLPKFYPPVEPPSFAEGEVGGLVLGVFRRAPCPSVTRGRPCALLLSRGCPAL